MYDEYIFDLEGEILFTKEIEMNQNLFYVVSLQLKLRI